MPRYAITEKAGRFVAAHRNTGVGMVLELAEKQAEHELRLGTLVALSATPETSDPPSMSPPEPPPGANSQAGQLPPTLISDPARKSRRGKQ